MSFSHFWLSSSLPRLSGGKWVSNWVGAELPPAGLDPSQHLTNIQLILVCHYPCFSQQYWQEPYGFICSGLSSAPGHGNPWDVAFKLVNTEHGCSWISGLLWSAAHLASSCPSHPLMGFHSRASQGCSLQVSHAWKDEKERSEAALCVAKPCRAVTRTFSQAWKVESGRCPQVCGVNIDYNIGYLKKSLHFKEIHSLGSEIDSLLRRK